MNPSTTPARLIEGPENPLGERDVEVGLVGDELELRPIVEVDGVRHELRLVSFADGEEMPAYAYERAVHDDATPRGFGCP